jgi:8-oxo-dGTP pyrophosphatase MutT (NUDIX family)
MSRLDPPRLRAALSARVPRRVPVVPPLREAAVALVLVPHEDDAALLFIKRAEHQLDPWSGQIALPGGRRDPQDSNLQATAIRETAEETSIRLPPEDALGELDDLSPVSPHLPPLIVRPFVFALAAEPPVRRSAEVADHLWVPLPQLRDHLHEERVTIRDRTLLVPAYRVGHHVIWGMTERIVTPFLQIAGQGEVTSG